MNEKYLTTRLREEIISVALIYLVWLFGKELGFELELIKVVGAYALGKLILYAWRYKHYGNIDPLMEVGRRGVVEPSLKREWNERSAIEMEEGFITDEENFFDRVSERPSLIVTQKAVLDIYGSVLFLGENGSFSGLIETYIELLKKNKGYLNKPDLSFNYINGIFFSVGIYQAKANHTVFENCIFRKGTWVKPSFEKTRFINCKYIDEEGIEKDLENASIIKGVR
jgi:hypothetical protein